MKLNFENGMKEMGIFWSASLTCMLLIGGNIKITLNEDFSSTSILIILIILNLIIRYLTYRHKTN